MVLIYFETIIPVDCCIYKSHLKFYFMKARVSNLIRYFKKLSAKKEVSSASVSFEGSQTASVVRPKNRATDFFEEFKEAIRSGDDPLWRMWR